MNGTSLLLIRAGIFARFFTATLVFCLFHAVLNTVSGQTSGELIRSGNKLYSEKKYNEAEVSYRKSLAAEKENKAGQYNLGNAFYKQGNFENSSKQYEQLLQRKDLSNEQKSNALHNMGNSLLQEKKYPESINAFKESLKLNPKDNDTRYNLAYAQSMLRQQQQQKNQKSDQNKDQKNQDQQKQQQQDQQQGKQDEKKQDQSSASKEEDKKGKQQQGKQSKQGISKEDAEKILQALNNDEKKLQEKLNKKDASRVSIDKNW